MASNADSPKLSCLFQEIWKLYDEIETTDKAINCAEIQAKVTNGLELTENAIHMVNELSLFSDNEDIEEVSTNEIRYMLLPALSAFFTLKNSTSDRHKTIKKGQSHYVEFLKLMKLYGVTQVHIPKIHEADQVEESSSKKKAPDLQLGDPDLLSMANQRQQKIERFKQQKQTESKLKELHTAVQKESVDDEVKREYYLTLLKKWVHTTLEELESIEMELPILEHMAKMKASGSNGVPPPSNHGNKQQGNPKPQFHPFILTKDKLQARVFGAGYPSLPTYSVEEWFDQQVQAGRLPDPKTVQSLQNAATDPLAEVQQNENEDEEKERKIEQDDSETLQKAREWDDWKDDHRRGWGNRQNMG